MTTTSRVITKVIKAAAVALIVELTDVALDKAGLPADRLRVARKILKSAVGAAGNSLLDKMLDTELAQAGGTVADAAGSPQPGS